MGPLPDAAAETLNRRAALLLAGPRGRRLCLEAVDTNNPNLGIFLLDPPGGSHDGAVRAKIAADVERTLETADLGARADVADPWRAMEPFSSSVSRAMYWQPPDEADLWLAEPEIAELLWPVARALAGSPAHRWWFEPVDAASQAVVEWVGEIAPPGPDFTGAGAKLASWRKATLSDEAAAAARAASTRKRQTWGEWTGSWWSVPSLCGLVATTRMLNGDDGRPAGCVRLTLVEDSLGWKQAVLWPVSPVPGASVYEIAEPVDWVDLVARYPLEVTASRRSDWYHTTGHDERWLMPDWQAVALAHDGVHLQSGAYLGGAGRSLDVDGRKTVIAGFDPDLTYWLTDSVVPAGDPERWRLAGHEQEGWRREPGESPCT